MLLLGGLRLSLARPVMTWQAIVWFGTLWRCVVWPSKERLALWQKQARHGKA